MEPILKKDTELKFPHALLISASAGSGKTYTLAKRYIQLLLSDKIAGNKLENLLAVTFTNNAAKEMKSRILEWLKEIALDKNAKKMDETLELAGLSRDEIHKKAQKLTDAVIDNYSDFHIQTIDSFLARVMSCSVDELKLPLDPDITMTYDILIDTALYSMFSRIGKKDMPYAAIDGFLAVLPGTGSYPWNPVERIKEIFSWFLNEEGKTKGLLPERGDADSGKAAEEKFAQALKFCMGLIEQEQYAALIKDSSLGAIESKNFKDFIGNYSPDYGILNGQKRKKFPAAWEKDFPVLSGLVCDMAQMQAASYYHPYIGIYNRFKLELEKIKRGKTDVIHINDIAKCLSAYIGRNTVPEVYLKLGEQITHFLIDEFQDTNSLQWDVLRPLAEETLSKKGSLFVVGDIKQAVYMFRSADYKIMKDFLDAAEGKKSRADNLSLDSLSCGLELVNLPVNYRSGGEILKYVDDLFKNRIKNRPALIGEDITELTVFSQQAQEERRESGWVQTQVMEDGDLPGEMSLKERLLDIVKSAKERFRLNEIAILVAKNKRIEQVAAWLNEAGIPVASLSSLDIRKRKIIAELISLLKFLESPSDDLSFSNFITGDIFAEASGLDRRRLLDFIFKSRTADRNALLYASFKDHPVMREYWSVFFSGLFKKTGYLPFYELVSLIYSQFRLFENFKEESAFLVKFMDAVIKLEAKGASDAKTFIESAQGDDEDKTAVFSIGLPDYIDAVRIMTFHKSKGLGFSAVINLIYEERGDHNPMYFEKTGGRIYVYHITKKEAELSPKLKKIYAYRETDGRVQDLNLLYVISTRAKHELYNLVVKKKRKSASEEPKLTDIHAPFQSQGSRTAPAQKTGRPAPAPIDIIRAHAKEDPRGFEAVKPTYGNYYETSEGELCHDILSKIDYMDYGAVRTAGKLYDRFVSKYNFTFDKIKILDNLNEFLNLPEISELFSRKDGRIIKTEAEFADKNGALLRMDRLVIDKDKITVIDFKTGAPDTEKHRAQMRNYAAILKEAYKNAEVRAVLAYIDLKKIEEV